MKKNRAPKRPAPAIETKPGIWPTLLLLLAILLVLIARLRLLNVPLERDEGEYAYMGQLLLQGVAPFKLAANMKLPGTSGAYALAMAIFGQTAVGIHIGLLVANAGAVALMYFIGRRLFNRTAGVAAAACYAVLTVAQDVRGIWAHATQFVVLPALGALLLLLRWKDTRRAALLVSSGLLFGIAFLMKQPGIFFAIFGAAFLVWTLRGRLLACARDLAIFGAAAALPFGLLCFWLWRAGVFDRFWFWIFTYARAYGSMVTLSDGAQNFWDAFSQILAGTWPIWILAAIGVVVIASEESARAEAPLLAAFSAFAFLAVCPGLYFRQHYFVLPMPAVALLASAGVKHLRGAVFPWVAAGAVLLALIGQSGYLFLSTPLEISRETYHANPFPEAVEIGAYIKSHSTPNDQVVVLGSEPEIYFYATRRSPTPYIYTYSLMERQPYALRMQQEMIRDVEAAQPEYLVMVNVAMSWLRQPTSQIRLLEWIPGFIESHYTPVGVADILPEGTVYKWDRDAASYRPGSQNTVIVFRHNREVK